MNSISCLVVSKSYKLLNQLIISLDKARKDWSDSDEILCSWNGSDDDEERIITGQKLEFRVGQKEPYHFAKNINALAKIAKGDYVLIINDDVILDENSIDKSLEIIEENTNIGILGGLLRTSNKNLSHAGVLINCDLMPYNRCRPEFGNRIELDNNEVKRCGQITAVTGALILMKKDDLVRIKMREIFSNCCEDIALCLDLLDKTNKVTYFSSDVTGIHDEKSTRGETNDIDDFVKLRALIKMYKDTLPGMWEVNTFWQGHECEWLKNMCYKEFTKHQKEEEIIIKQKQELNRIESELSKTVKSWNLDRQLFKSGQEDLEKRISEIEMSTSWKITKPIRYISNFIRKT